MMSRKLVKDYAIGWYPGSNRAVLTLVLEDGKRHELPVESAEELAALAAVLQEPKVYLYDDGLLASRWDEIKEK
jgi:hypothetical protein